MANGLGKSRAVGDCVMHGNPGHIIVQQFAALSHSSYFHSYVQESLLQSIVQSKEVVSSNSYLLWKKLNCHLGTSRTLTITYWLLV